MKIFRLVILCGALLASSGTVLAEPPSPVNKALRTSTRFVDTTVGAWVARDQPQLVKQPSLAGLIKSDPKSGAADFALSFNCAVKRDGGLTDCRVIYGTSDISDKPGLTTLIARDVRMSQASASMAHEKAYRLTVDVALDTLDRHGNPQACRPPFCIIEGAVPPPPPQPVRDPAMAAALDRAQKCFTAAWEKSRELRFAAERALKDRAGQAASDGDRMLVLDYVKSREQQNGCINALRETSRLLPLDRSDVQTVSQALDVMKLNYDGQAPYERMILIGVLNQSVAKAEHSAP